MIEQTLPYSVIIPTLNEAASIGTCITAIRRLDPSVEIIVADGGSSDATIDIARSAGALVCTAPRGRGTQMNAGAARASGATLVFLHADTLLPPDAFVRIGALFANPQAQVAKFRLWFDTRNMLLDLAAICMWIDSIMTSYGDQGIVVRRDFFMGLGGFPDWALFEDVRLFELARRETQVHVIPACVVTSARRFRENGVLRQLVHDLWLMIQYLWGVSPQALAQAYA